VEAFLTLFVIPTCAGLLVVLFPAKDLSTRRRAVLGLIFFVLACTASLWLTHPWRGAAAQHWVVAGTVEDDTTREGIRQAKVFIEGVISPYIPPYITEDNGNFRIELNGTWRNAERVRIKVTKAGYKDYEVTLTPPKDNLTVLLQKL
jgi:hypothetical protein